MGRLPNLNLFVFSIILPLLKRGKEEAWVKLDEFYRQIRTARLRAAQLYQRARKALLQQQELLVEGFEELYDALEELQVAEEKLSQLNEELAAARKLVEVERQRYQDLFELVPDAYLVTNVRGIITEANSAAARLLNVPQQFLVGKPFATFISKEERLAFLTKMTGLHQPDLGQEWEVRLQPRNGKSFDASLTVVTLHHQEGRLIALGWLLRDIIKHKQTEETLGLLSSAVQHAQETIVITSAELDYPGPKYVFVNPAFTEMTGYTVEELTDKTPRILQGAKTERSVLDRLRRSLSQGEYFHSELTNYHKDGTEYKVELSCSPIRDERGEITHFISIQRDITQRQADS